MSNDNDKTSEGHKQQNEAISELEVSRPDHESREDVQGSDYDTQSETQLEESSTGSAASPAVRTDITSQSLVKESNIAFSGHKADFSSAEISADPSENASPAASPLQVPRYRRRDPSVTSSPLSQLDRRFSSRLHLHSRDISGISSGAGARFSSRASSAAFSARFGKNDLDVEGTFEVIRWSKLKKVSEFVFTEGSKRKYGHPTCMAVAGSIALGTSRGLVLIFDYTQKLTAVIGQESKAIEAGAVTSLTIAADQSTVAVGHVSGYIFTWELAHPTNPFLQIAPHDPLRMNTAAGHLQDAAIVQIGFLGTRHTALVSADNKGMAFSHLATRGLGAVARAIKTTRILGKYENAEIPSLQSRKPSSVFSCAALPLGNDDCVTDSAGFVAIQTPYLMVIVSTMPIAQTQFKFPRPRSIPLHSAMSGALAWYPAMKAQRDDTLPRPQRSAPKLVFCWSGHITTLSIDVSEIQDSAEEVDIGALSFVVGSQKVLDETVVAIQWLTSSLLAALTVTQQLIVLDDSDLRILHSIDLIPKQIYHADYHSAQLDRLVNQLDDAEMNGMHGVVADVFSMSLQTYKGRLFALGHNEVFFGTLLKWTDRLRALTDTQRYIEAILLATRFYTGDEDAMILGLPADAQVRQKLLKPSLMELISASLHYQFSPSSMPKSVSERSEMCGELARVCLEACITCDQLEYLLDEGYSVFAEHLRGPEFLDQLEIFVEADKIQSLPPSITKDFIQHLVSQDRNSKLEEVLVRLDPRTMDLDQITRLCRQNSLYEALLYVWTEALHDYTSILAELLQLCSRATGSERSKAEFFVQHEAELKIFPYLSYTLTGRIFPTGLEISEEKADHAKSSIYRFFFSGRQPSGDESNESESSDSHRFWPLKQVLIINAMSFMSVLNEAFEDAFLNNDGHNGLLEDGHEFPDAAKPYDFIDRQWIVDVLLRIMVPPAYSEHDIVYLYIFCARNLAKYPQFILLPGNVLHEILTGLCEYSGGDLGDECQLSVESLLTVYQPSDLSSFIGHFTQRSFYRVLKKVYRSERQYTNYLEACFSNEDDESGIFDGIALSLKDGTLTNPSQRPKIEQIILSHGSWLVRLDAQKTYTVLETWVPHLHQSLLERLQNDEKDVYRYLKVLFEVRDKREESLGFKDSKLFWQELHVRLMCKFEPDQVRGYIEHLNVKSLELESILPSLDDAELSEAAAILLSRAGRIREGLDRVIGRLATLTTTLAGLLDFSKSEEATMTSTLAAQQDAVDSMRRLTRVGLWICREAMQTSDNQYTMREVTESRMSPHDLESLWIELLAAVAQAMVVGANGSPGMNENQDAFKDELSGMVQDAFTALLQSTTVTSNARAKDTTTFHEWDKDGTARTEKVSFLRILQAFLNRASLSSPSISSLRSVLGTVLSAYSYEAQLLTLSSQLIDTDLFAQVQETDRQRRRGWRPLGQICGICQGRVWGLGAGRGVWEAYQKRQSQRAQFRVTTSRSANRYAPSARSGEGLAALQYASTRKSSRDKGKGRAIEQAPLQPEHEDAREAATDDKDFSRSSNSLVTFACRHIFHRACLDRDYEHAAPADDLEGHSQQYRCPLCNPAFGKV